MSKVPLSVKLLTPGAKLPHYETSGASGFDFRADLTEECTIPPRETRIIPTGLAFDIPQGFEIQVRSRSGLAAKFGVFVLNSPGTVDADYRGEVKAILMNTGSEPFVVKPGDRIAQGVLSTVPIAELSIVEELTETHRGNGGFGSTGAK